MDENVPTSAGLSSYNLLDVKLFFQALELQHDHTVLELGCGVGNYVVAIAPYLGGSGHILGLDLWNEGIETLRVRADMQRMDNLLPVVADVCAGLPVRRGSIDCCLMATVVHILKKQDALAGLLAEIKKILRPGGMLAVIEFLKISGQPGPPIEWRLSQAELRDIFLSFGYNWRKNCIVGPYNYLSVFNTLF